MLYSSEQDYEAVGSFLQVKQGQSFDFPVSLVTRNAGLDFDLRIEVYRQKDGKWELDPIEQAAMGFGGANGQIGGGSSLNFPHAITVNKVIRAKGAQEGIYLLVPVCAIQQNGRSREVKGGGVILIVGDTKGPDQLKSDTQSDKQRQ